MSANSKQTALQNVQAPAEVVRMLRKQVNNLEQSSQWKPSTQWKQTDQPPGQSSISRGCQAFDQILPLVCLRWLGLRLGQLQDPGLLLLRNRLCRESVQQDKGF